MPIPTSPRPWMLRVYRQWSQIRCHSARTPSSRLMCMSSVLTLQQIKNFPRAHIQLQFYASSPSPKNPGFIWNHVWGGHQVSQSGRELEQRGQANPFPICSTEYYPQPRHFHHSCPEWYSQFPETHQKYAQGQGETDKGDWVSYVSLGLPRPYLPTL